MTQYTVGGTKLIDVGRPRREYPTGRVCSNSECSTILSMYNKDGLCYVHKPFKRPRLRGKLPSEIMEEEPKRRKCISCVQRNRHARDEAIEVVIDGIVHREGSLGKATLCEGL